jgi:ribosomal protein L17
MLLSFPSQLGRTDAHRKALTRSRSHCQPNGDFRKEEQYVSLQNLDSPAVGTKTVKDIAGIIRRIEEMPGCAGYLRVIAKAGAKRDALLDLLVRAVIEPEGRSLTNRIRAKQRELRSVAMQIITVARYAERLANDSFSYPQFCSPFNTREFQRHKEQETARLASRWPFQAMLDYANWAQNEARTFGHLLRRNSQKERRLGILFLLFWVNLHTKKLFEHELSQLLIYASEAAGKPRNFTAANLRKMFERHVLPSRRRHPDI